ncbi:MAG: M24 family metallopeptidase, partial [Gammaproteobacteria bacterium]|nr:M24 family metallopeptidase [Gammaproteobacteria bacterium]
ETIKKIRPGARWDQLQASAEQIITAGLLDSGLLKGKIKTLLAEQTFKPYFMHKIGHWLGLDTHDAGKYYINDKWRTLEPGMVLTIEPGIYIAPNITGIDKKWLGTGIRIEDNILVTTSGYEVLTTAAPKSVREIEKIMKK